MITPALVYVELAAARTVGSFPFTGYTFDQLAWAIAYAVATWFPTGVTLKGVSVGTAGVGAINTPVSKLVLIPNPSLVIGGLVSAGMEGPLSVALGTVVAVGLAKAVSSYGQYAGGVTGVGVGGDVAKAVSVNAPALITQLQMFMASFMGSGPATTQMATGLGTGIASLALTITGTGTVLGSPSIYPATGQSVSVVV